MSVLLLHAECVYLSLIFGNELPVFEVQIISSIELSNNRTMPVLFCLKLGANVKYIFDLAPATYHLLNRMDGLSISVGQSFFVTTVEGISPNILLQSCLTLFVPAYLRVLGGI